VSIIGLGQLVFIMENNLLKNQFAPQVERTSYAYVDKYIHSDHHSVYFIYHEPIQYPHCLKSHQLLLLGSAVWWRVK